MRETTTGTTPASPRLRAMRVTGESLAFNPIYVESDEIRADRMQNDPILSMQSSGGGINFELSYPDDNSPLSEIIRSAMFNAWTNTPTFFNDTVAASVVSNATVTTYTVASGGAAVVTGHLVRATGFTNAANNFPAGFRAATGSATTVVGTALGLTTEAAPPGTAKLKVIGFQGVATDITATATGLASTALDFTTLGLTVGRWIKVGGTVTAFRFATAANNDWVRVTTIAANALTCDNLPTGWTVDAGTGKTLNVYFGDTIKNGVTPSTVSIERGFLGQTVPTYIINRGMNVNNLTTTISSKAKITGSAAFLGMGGSESQATVAATLSPVTTGSVMAANASVGRLGVNGSQLVGPNWAKSITVVIDNSLREIDAVDSINPVAIREGECKVSGKMETYFGNDTELAAFYAGTTRPINCRVAKNSQAIIFQIPRATYKGGGNPSASAKNSDVLCNFDYMASIDSVTSAHAIIDRCEYFEV